ncbi:diacylglycerol/lipid kinase family protein [Nocardioides panacisoli]|uniref:diacylglycerol/lipid kinase family protein n=1 Tax=Nocardioides panacisoli TaxID=627624 RepID=UPI001F270074|nr:diacylglycerol kinase family protein [Nocardioides panacisoli]
MLVITNADAGTADQETVRGAVAILREQAEVELCATATPEELDDVLASAGSRRIVVAGGDGSMHAVVAALHRRGELRGATLGLLPLGTGNDLARSLGIPLDADLAARTVLEGTDRPMDVLLDDAGGIVVNSVHFGAGATAGEHGARWKQRLGRVGVGKVNLGKLGYPIGAAVAAVKPTTVRVRVTADGDVVTDLDRPVLMVVLANGSSVGGGTELAPGANPSDGHIDVLVASPESFSATLRYAAGVALRRHPEHENVTTLRAREVAVNGGTFTCSADGELSGPVRSRTWRLEQAAYALAVPAR